MYQPCLIDKKGLAPGWGLPQSWPEALAYLVDPALPG